MRKLNVHQFGHVHGVCGHQFITKTSIVNSAECEMERKIDFYLLDRHGDGLVEYDQKHLETVSEAVKDCVLFVNAVNNGKSQPVWFNYPVRSCETITA